MSCCLDLQLEQGGCFIPDQGRERERHDSNTPDFLRSGGCYVQVINEDARVRWTRATELQALNAKRQPHLDLVQEGPTYPDFLVAIVDLLPPRPSIGGDAEGILLA